MVNYQDAIITEIKTRLEDIGTLGLVGEYPDTNAGLSYPVALVVDGYETVDTNAGMNNFNLWQVSIFLSVEGRVDRLANVSSIQNSIISAMLVGGNLSQTASTIRVLTIEKGQYSSQLSNLDVGYSEGKTNRMINFEIGVCNYVG